MEAGAGPLSSGSGSAHRATATRIRWTCRDTPELQWTARTCSPRTSQPKPLGDPPSPGVQFLPLLFVLHELVLHLLHGALGGGLGLLWEEVGEGEGLALSLMGTNGRRTLEFNTLKNKHFRTGTRGCRTIDSIREPDRVTSSIENCSLMAPTK